MLVEADALLPVVVERGHPRKPCAQSRGLSLRPSMAASSRCPSSVAFTTATNIAPCRTGSARPYASTTTFRDVRPGRLVVVKFDRRVILGQLLRDPLVEGVLHRQRDDDPPALAKERIDFRQVLRAELPVQRRSTLKQRSVIDHLPGECAHMAHPVKGITPASLCQSRKEWR